MGEESFKSILVMEGEGEIVNGDEKMSFKKGDSLFLPADSGAYEISGAFEALVTSEGAKKNRSASVSTWAAPASRSAWSMRK